MIIILFQVVSDSIIPYTDGFAKIIIQPFFYIVRITIYKCITESIESLAFFSCVILKPFCNLFFKNIFYLPVWYSQLDSSVIRLPSSGQISGCKKYAPYIIIRFVNIFISQLLTNVFRNCLTSYQSFDIASCRSRRRITSLLLVLDQYASGLAPGFRRRRLQ